MSAWSQKDVKVVVDRLLNQLRINGLVVNIGIEIEFYLRKEGRVPDDDAIARFSSLIPNVTLEKERGSGQYEFAMQYREAAKAVVALLKLKEYMAAAAHSCAMDLMLHPKPFADDYGSAMHFHLSLHNQGGDNIFTNKKDMMEDIILSLLSLVDTDLDFLCNEGDFARLQPGWMAPSHLSWGGNNRSVVIRMPHDVPAHRRFEFRLPSADADPYRVLLFLLVGVVLTPMPKIQHPKIYGNAYDLQYNLPRLEFCNNIRQKRFLDLKSLTKYLEKFSEHNVL